MVSQRDSPGINIPEFLYYRKARREIYQTKVVDTLENSIPTQSRYSEK